MRQQSILSPILNAVESITWKNELEKTKAITICKCIFNQFLNSNESFSNYLTLSNKYLQNIYTSNRDYIIKDKLIANQILLCNDSYNVKKGIGKGYKFNEELFKTNISSTAFTFVSDYRQTKPVYALPQVSDIRYQNVIGSEQQLDYNYTVSKTTDQSFLLRHSTGSLLSPHPNSAQYLYGFYSKLIIRVYFDEDVDELITTLSDVRKLLVYNYDIAHDYVDINLSGKSYRFSTSKAIKLAQSLGKELIQCKNSFYIDHPQNFIADRGQFLKICFAQKVFNINNNVIYCNRNDTNNRLDYNFTALKKELFQKLKFDNEKLVEIDIANAQFAIAAYLNNKIDGDFISLAQTGELYNYIEDKLNLPPKAGKERMFRIAFDMNRNIDSYNCIRQLFPKFMHWVDSYKDQHGYKMFSNLLQKTEAEIMIDGLLFFLIERGFEVFPVHDAIRVKESQVSEVYDLVTEYFGTIGFVCKLRIRA